MLKELELDLKTVSEKESTCLAITAKNMSNSLKICAPVFKQTNHVLSCMRSKQCNLHAKNVKLHASNNSDSRSMYTFSVDKLCQV